MTIVHLKKAITIKISSYLENRYFDKNLYYVKYNAGDLMLLIPLNVKFK